jgi:hypothetical protein
MIMCSICEAMVPWVWTKSGSCDSCYDMYNILNDMEW